MVIASIRASWHFTATGLNPHTCFNPVWLYKKDHCKMGRPALQVGSHLSVVHEKQSASLNPFFLEVCANRREHCFMPVQLLNLSSFVDVLCTSQCRHIRNLLQEKWLSVLAPSCLFCRAAQRFIVGKDALAVLLPLVLNATFYTYADDTVLYSYPWYWVTSIVWSPVLIALRYNLMPNDTNVNNLTF